MRRYICTVCGYIHEGDGPPDECPVCGAPREAFEPVTVQAPGAQPEPPEASVPAPAPASGPRWIILGGGIAGLSGAEAARESDSDADITLIHRENALPYQRLNLTRYLAGGVGKEKLTIHEGGWFDAQRIRLVRAEARRLDREQRRLVLDDGRELAYDRLLLATGAHAFVPPIPGIRLHGVHVLRTLADADAILERARRGINCVCIGGGLLGLETAGGLAGRGLAVTVLDEGRWLLSRQLARSASERLVSHLSGIGLSIRSQVKVAAISGDESVRAVSLADGSEIPADLVVLAAGIRPNTGMPRAAGLTANRAIVIDDGMRTSDPNILAAGDVAEHRGVSWGLWVVAQEQGRLAGLAMAGKRVVYEGTAPATQLKVLNWPVISVGAFEPAEPDDQVLEQADSTRLTRVVLRNQTVIGGNLVGDAALAAPLRRAVQEKSTIAQVPEFSFLSRGSAL